MLVWLICYSALQELCLSSIIAVPEHVNNTKERTQSLLWQSSHGNAVWPRMPPSWSPWPQPVLQWTAQSPSPWGMNGRRTEGTSRPMGGRGRHWQGGGEKQGRARRANPWKLPCKWVTFAALCYKRRSLLLWMVRWGGHMVVYIAAGSGCSACKERRVVWNRGRWDQMQQAAGLLGGCLQNKRASQTLWQLLHQFHQIQLDSNVLN